MYKRKAIISTLSLTRSNLHSRIRTMYCIVLCTNTSIYASLIRIPSTTIWPHKYFNRNNKRAYVIRCGRAFFFSQQNVIKHGQRLGTETHYNGRYFGYRAIEGVLLLINSHSSCSWCVIQMYKFGFLKESKAIIKHIPYFRIFVWCHSSA